MKKTVKWTWFRNLGDYLFQDEEVKNEKRTRGKKKTLERKKERKEKKGLKGEL